MAVSMQGLGFLESGITDPLNHFSNTLLEFSALLRHTVRPPSAPPVPSRASYRRSSFNVNLNLSSLSSYFFFRSATSAPQTHASTDPFLAHLQALLAYSQAHKAVLRLRDQKQLDFEELSDYLATVTADRDRLAAMISGHVISSGLGIGAYLRDKVDALRGADDDRSRVEKMRKLDGRIKEVRLDLLSITHT
jgi:sorting nexin-4